MKHKNNGFWPWLILFLGFPILAYILKNVLTEFVIDTLFTTAVISGIIVVQGIFITPNDPPHFSIIERWAVRLWKKNDDGNLVVVYTNEGWNWVFLRGLKHKVKSVNISKREIDFPEQILTTPDAVTTRVPGSLAYTPHKESIINLLNLGTDDPFKVFEDMINDIVEEKLRIWSRNPNKGPKTWEDLLDSTEEAAKMLIEAISAMEIPEADLKKVQAGQGDWLLEKFGVTLNRLNLKEMIPFGEVYEQALKVKDEKQQREAETYELTTDIQKAKKLQEEFRSLSVEKSIEECMKLIMDWKIQREANTLLTLGAFAKNIASAFKKQAA